MHRRRGTGAFFPCVRALMELTILLKNNSFPAGATSAKFNLCIQSAPPLPPSLENMTWKSKPAPLSCPPMRKVGDRRGAGRMRLISHSTQHGPIRSSPYFWNTLASPCRDTQRSLSPLNKCLKKPYLRLYFRAAIICFLTPQCMGPYGARHTAATEIRIL